MICGEKKVENRCHSTQYVRRWIAVVVTDSITAKEKNELHRLDLAHKHEKQKQTIVGFVKFRRITNSYEIAKNHDPKYTFESSKYYWLIDDHIALFQDDYIKQAGQRCAIARIKNEIISRNANNTLLHYLHYRRKKTND